jgi:hypothetical protein
MNILGRKMTVEQIVNEIQSLKTEGKGEVELEVKINQYHTQEGAGVGLLL